MNATPGAKSEYSRGSQGFWGDLADESEPPDARGARSTAPRPPRRAPRPSRPARRASSWPRAVIGRAAPARCCFRVHDALPGAKAVRQRRRQSIGAGSNHAYVLVPIGCSRRCWSPGLRAAAAGRPCSRRRARPRRAADRADRRPPRRAGERARRSAATRYTNATSIASAGLYMETLGAVVLIASVRTGVRCWGSRGGGRRGPRPTARPVERYLRACPPALTAVVRPDRGDLALPDRGYLWIRRGLFYRSPRSRVVGGPRVPFRAGGPPHWLQPAGADRIINAPNTPNGNRGALAGGGIAGARWNGRSRAGGRAQAMGRARRCTTCEARPQRYADRR